MDLTPDSQHSNNPWEEIEYAHTPEASSPSRIGSMYFRLMETPADNSKACHADYTPLSDNSPWKQMGFDYDNSWDTDPPAPDLSLRLYVGREVFCSNMNSLGFMDYDHSFVNLEILMISVLVYVDKLLRLYTTEAEFVEQQVAIKQQLFMKFYHILRKRIALERQSKDHGGYQMRQSWKDLG